MIYETVLTVILRVNVKMGLWAVFDLSSAGM